MAITSEGSRRIEVDGISYRWFVRLRPTYVQGFRRLPPFAVQLAGKGMYALHTVATLFTEAAEYIRMSLPRENRPAQKPPVRIMMFGAEEDRTRLFEALPWLVPNVGD